MKIRLKISKAHYESVRQELETAGIGIEDTAPYVLTEADSPGVFLDVRTAEGERMKLAANEIVFIESYGHNVDVHAKSGGLRSAVPDRRRTGPGPFHPRQQLSDRRAEAREKDPPFPLHEIRSDPVRRDPRRRHPQLLRSIP